MTASAGTSLCQADGLGAGFLSVVLEVFPEVRPGLAEVPAEKDVRKAVDRIVHDPVSVRKLANQFAGGRQARWAKVELPTQTRSAVATEVCPPRTVRVRTVLLPNDTESRDRKAGFRSGSLDFSVR